MQTQINSKLENAKEIKRCSRCILPENFPDIKFNNKGECSKCQEYDKKYRDKDYVKLGKELKDIINWAKSQNKKYDCIIPFSGGKDSSYTLYICRKKYGLKTLAVNFNNGLRTTAALKNIEKIIKNLDVGYACYGPNWGLMKKLYREFFLKTGQFCFPCDAGIWATVEKMAEAFDIPLIVSGFSSQIEKRGPKIYSYNNKLIRSIAINIISRKEIKDFLEVTKWNRLIGRIKRFDPRRYRRQISLPNYIVWDDKEIKDIITNELGWEKKEDGSSDHIDCLFAPMKNYLVVQKWGFGEKTTKYSAMVRTKEMEREKALNKAQEKEFVDISDSIRKFIEILGVTREEIEAAKSKTHLAYL